MSTRAFSSALDISEATTRNYLERGTKPSADYLEKVVRHFSRVNPTWLLTGEGPMFLDEGSNSSDNSQKNIGTNNVGNIGTNNGTAMVHYTTLSDCEKDLNAAQERIVLLSSQLQDKERIIQLLELQLKK